MQSSFGRLLTRHPYRHRDGHARKAACANLPTAGYRSDATIDGQVPIRFLRMVVLLPVVAAGLTYAVVNHVGLPVRSVLDSCAMSESPRTVVVARVLRGGTQLSDDDDDWKDSTPAERLSAVWEITRQCLQWNRTETDEPRLQRSVGRVQRPPR
jgi:hypothetical protein